MNSRAIDETWARRHIIQRKNLVRHRYTNISNVMYEAAYRSGSKRTRRHIHIYLCVCLSLSYTCGASSVNVRTLLDIDIARPSCLPDTTPYGRDSLAPLRP